MNLKHSQVQKTPLNLVCHASEENLKKKKKIERKEKQQLSVFKCGKHCFVQDAMCFFPHREECTSGVPTQMTLGYS